jgi:primosomal protein N' (replication factor Y) (superfamily II helicase)
MTGPSLVDVAIPQKVASSFHYLLEPGQEATLQIGSVVQVNFHHRQTHAFVLGFPEKSSVPLAKLKAVEKVLLSEPLFDEAMLGFLKWVAEYYCHPLGEVIAAAVPKQYITATEEKKLKALELDPLEFASLGPTAAPQLTADQIKALEAIAAAGDKPVLLHGVTGSGKTEVYIRALEKVIAEGKGGMILVPEIALTPQLLGRFSSRFPGQVAVLHSDLSPKERLAQWEKLRRGMAKIVIGARSAVFAPVKQLGLIIVDEEHETSFKQEDSLRYHARDVAVVRARLLGSKVILGSATPSLESYANTRNGRYAYVGLPNRVQHRPLPRVTVVDLREKDAWQSPETPWLSHALVVRIRETLARGQQTLLYLNRLGYAHFLFCADCGHTWRCRQCDVALTYYKNPPSLQCHYCGAKHAVNDCCDACGSAALDTLGVGTEQVEKSLKELLPEARIARMDRSIIKTRSDLETILTSVAQREVDIVIGTQMIAKGHDFPGIALVGILMADATLNMPDFRANERTFQIITQVSGRAGRGDIPGEVILQSLNPEAPVLHQAIENQFEVFYRSEIEARAVLGFPPSKRLAMLRFQHKNPARVQEIAERVVAFLVTRRTPGIQILGPAEAPLSRIKGLHRWHCLIKSESVRELQSALNNARQYADFLKSGVQMALDIDPANCM